MRETLNFILAGATTCPEAAMKAFFQRAGYCGLRTAFMIPIISG
jgi:hypothetical protein